MERSDASPDNSFDALRPGRLPTPGHHGCLRGSGRAGRTQSLRTTGAWLHDLCRAIAEPARHGLALHQKLALTSTEIGRRIEGRRRSLRLPNLARLIYERPFISAPFVPKDLTAGSVIREMTDRRDSGPMGSSGFFEGRRDGVSSAHLRGRNRNFRIP